MLNFLGIGAQKCATSWLHAALSQHPSVDFPGGKEIHFWNRPAGRDLAWYSQLFSSTTHVNGEITPAYGILPTNIIQNIHFAFPQLRLIYLIRNPIHRAWSAARMALTRAEMDLDEASDQWFLDHFKSNGSLARGDYETCIRQWRAVYPANQLLIVTYESIQMRPTSVLTMCLKHLGLEDTSMHCHPEELNKRVFEGPEMILRPQLLEALSLIYQDKIDSLSQYLEQDFSDWKSA